MTTLIDSRMAAVLLGCTPRRVRQLVVTGVLTNRGGPNQLRLSLAEVDAYGQRRARRKSS